MSRHLRAVDCEVEHVLLREEDGFAVCRTDFINWLHRDLDMVFLCNPNNPTGISIDREFLVPGFTCVQRNGYPSGRR